MEQNSDNSNWWQKQPEKFEEKYDPKTLQPLYPPSMFPSSVPGAPKYIQGIDGWLIFWISTIAVASLASLIVFYVSVTSGFKATDNYVALIFSLIMFAGFVATIYFIFTQKKLAKIAIVIALGAAALNSIICLLVSGLSITTIFIMLGAIFVQLTCSVICILYFFKSNRVKQTLIK